jgi:uncharacterized protein YbdZ (MbtH family)
MKKVDVIAAACEELSVSYENNALWFEILIDQAISTYNTANKFDIYEECVEVIDHRACVPDNFMKLMSVKIKAGACYFEGPDFSLQGRYIIFSSMLDIPEGWEVVVRYKGLALDEDGEVYIPEKWERMLVAYICYKYSRKNHKDYPAYIIQDYKREFAQQKASNA